MLQTQTVSQVTLELLTESFLNCSCLIKVF